MFRVSHPAPRMFRKAVASPFAMAFALAGVSVVSAGIVAPAPAFAQDKQEKPTYSRGFVKAYQPLQEAYNAAADAAAAEPVRAMLPDVIAAVENDDDKHALGNLILGLGSKLSDTGLQRQGLEMMLESGKVAPEQVGQFNFFIGNLAFQAEDYDASRAALEKALAAGFTDNEPQGLIVETYVRQNRNAEALAYILNYAKTGSPSEQMLLRGLQQAYDAGMVKEADEIAAELVRAYPSTKNWTASIQVVRELNEFPNQEMLDLTRLMMVTDSFQSGRDYIEYVEAADARRMPNEVKRVIDHAVAAGKLDMADIAVKEAYDIATARAETDREENPTLVGEARASDTGITALGVADVFLSYEDAANAEDMYAVALEKGGVDNDRVLTRMGIAQAMQGKYAEADATFDKVTGVREPIVALWKAYIASKQAGA